MNQSSDIHLIESLSTQSLGSAHWLQGVQFAAQVIFGASALALVREYSSENYQLAGLVGDAGNLLREPPEQLEYFTLSEELAALKGMQFSEQALFSGDIEMFTVTAKSAYFLPWPLGIQPRYGFVLFDATIANLSELNGPKHAFLTVANNLLRRETKRALIDAGAWIQSEIDKLATLQDLLQPADLEEIEGVALAVHSRPHAYAGGDYYDIGVAVDNENERRCLITVADVSGHGPAAVVETAMIDSILRTYADTHICPSERGPANVLTYLNKHMFTRRPRPSFATMFASELNLSSGLLRYSLAGHPPPIVKSSKRGFCGPIDSGEGIPLQILREYSWRDQTIELGMGDLLVVYSDGILEALSPAGVQFGQQTLNKIIANGSNEPRILLDQILSALDQHADNRAYHDDQTIVVAKLCDK
ncbi:MAG: PP2C family protein-serine/threonine phosphatase [Pseudomonadota bacterium]